MHLQTYRGMLRTSGELESHINRTNAGDGQLETVRIPVPTRFTGSRNEDFVEFAYTDIVDAAVKLLLDKKVLSSSDQILWRATEPDEEGHHRYTPNMNSGDWWRRTEIKFCTNGEGRMMDDYHLLPFIIFLDDTQVVTRGTRSAKPIILALGNTIEDVRNRPVSTIST